MTTRKSTEKCCGPENLKVDRRKAAEPRTVHKRVRFTEKEWRGIEREKQKVSREKKEDVEVSDLLRRLLEEALEGRRQRRLNDERGESNRCQFCGKWK